MSADVPTVEPESIRAGDTWAWTRTLDDYPAPTWTLTYTLINGTAKISITASASGSDHAIRVAAATTAAYAEGYYSWTASVSNGTDRYTHSTGVVRVLPDLVAATLYDARSNWRKLYDAMDAALATLGSKAWTISYTIGDRTVLFRSHAEFLQMYDRARLEGYREEQADKLARGLGTGQKVLVRL